VVGFTNGPAINIASVCKCPPFKVVTRRNSSLVVRWTRERESHTFADDPWQLILTLVRAFVYMAIIQFDLKVPKIGKIISASMAHMLFRKLLLSRRLFRRVALFPNTIDPSFQPTRKL
jgi:hypothetical protein